MFSTGVTVELIIRYVSDSCCCFKGGVSYMQTAQSVLTVMYDSFGNASFCFTLCYAYALVIV